MGMSSRTIERRVQSGRLLSIAPGVLALPGVTATEVTLLRAAGAAMGAIVSHESAARLHGLDLGDIVAIAITVPIRRTNRFESIVVHQSTDLDPSQVVNIDHLDATSIDRTLCDLAALYKGKRLGDFVDQAVDRRMTTYESISDQLERLARRGKPGVSNLRNVLESRSETPILTDSVLERRLVDLLISDLLPVPSVQFRPNWLKAVSGRVDIAYPQHRVIIEADSRRWHGSPEAFQADRRRDNLAQIAGWTILRFTWEDLTERPTYVCATVRSALR